jgi:YfiH family protein
VINLDSTPAFTEADASIATRAGVVCTIMTADCTPVLLADSRGRVVGAAHAGWRGLASGVLEATVKAMRDAGAEEILAWLGPGIGPHAFEVGQDVEDAFAHLQAERPSFRAIDEKPGKFLADLPELARRALAGVGVLQVTGGEHCTVSDPERFYSFRRDRTTGRMASMIWINSLSD